MDLHSSSSVDRGEGSQDHPCGWRKKREKMERRVEVAESSSRRRWSLASGVLP
tara:strand:+ start:471 stop:629 length:159 start_codon:yes stop_codon:yes gene_type:complete